MSQNNIIGALAPEAPIPTIADILGDQSTSFWLKNALRGSLQRDPVEAAHDAALLVRVLESRVDRLTETLLKARRA